MVKALKCGPALGLAYSRKFHGLFESFGMGELVIDIRESDGNAVIEGLGRTYQCRLELRAKLDEKIPNVRASVLGLFSRFSIDSEST